MNTDLFTGLWSIIKDIAGFFKFITFVDPWDEGILVRRGKYKRVVKSGVVWHQPFGFDDLHLTNVRPSAMELNEQTVETADGVSVTVCGVFLWSIFDVKKSMLDVEDAAETLSELSIGIIQEQIEQQDWEYINTPEFRKDITKAIQKAARKWGIAVSKFKFHDCTRVVALRVF